MIMTRPASSAAPIDRSAGLTPVVLIGEAPQARALGAALTGAGITVGVGSGAVDGAALKAAALEAAGLVIEASDAAASARAEALHGIEHAIDDHIPIAALLFTDTLAGLAHRVHGLQRLVGLSILDVGEPVRLVEIARSGASSRAAIAAVRAVFDAAGISTIVVADAPGHYVARVAHGYVNEGLALLGEGVPALAIEQAARQAGMALGPLALLDALSLDEADRLLHGASDSHGHGHGHGGHDHNDGGHAHSPAHEHPHTHHHEHAAPASAHRRAHGMTTEAIYVLEKMAHGFNRMGKQGGRGFYEYDEDDDQAPGLWSGLKVFERRRVSVSSEDLRDRLLYVQALESLRCLEEAVVASPADANLGSVLGWGFPDDTGGTIALVERIGSIAFIARARELAGRYGNRFDAPRLLARHAESGEPFASSLP